MSLGEIVLMLVVGLVVVGPRNLPPLMRTAGQWVAKLRRMSVDLRAQSGIDDLLRREGLDQHLSELRSLSRFNVVDTLMTPASAVPRPNTGLPYKPPPAGGSFHGSGAGAAPANAKQPEPLRQREYPLVGCDAYGALADDVAPYREPAAVKPELAAKDEPAPPAEPAVAEGATS